MDQVKFVEDSLQKIEVIWSALSRPYDFKFFKGCLPQILLGPFLNTYMILVDIGRTGYSVAHTFTVYGTFYNFSFPFGDLITRIPGNDRRRNLENLYFFFFLKNFTEIQPSKLISAFGNCYSLFEGNLYSVLRQTVAEEKLS